jgi:hypothetical protein
MTPPMESRAPAGGRGLQKDMECLYKLAAKFLGTERKAGT